MTIKEDVNGFDFDTGREYDENGWTEDWDETTVLQGDVIAVEKEPKGCDDYIVVRPTEDGIFAVPKESGDSIRPEVSMVEWDRVLLKIDRDEVVRDRPVMHDPRYTPDSLEIREDPGEDEDE